VNVFVFSTTKSTSARPTTATTSGFETTTFGYPTSTVYDPCEHLLQEINDGTMVNLGVLW
jgi:hypothetical protein